MRNRKMRTILSLLLLVALVMAAVPGKAARCADGCAAQSCGQLPCGGCVRCICDPPIRTLPVYPVPQAPATGGASAVCGALLLCAAAALAACLKNKRTKPGK